MRTALLKAFVAVLFMSAPSFVLGQTSPSFDCSKATGEVEKLVCADEELAALDRKLADVYAKSLESWSGDEVNTQKAMQRGWIKGRDDCWKADDLRSCVAVEYRTRTVELQIQSGQLMAPEAVGYACEGGENQRFVVTFYDETDPPSAVITYGGDQVIALGAPSSSGKEFVANGVEFAEANGEARVDWYGTTLVCKRR